MTRTSIVVCAFIVFQIGCSSRAVQNMEGATDQTSRNSNAPQTSSTAVDAELEENRKLWSESRLHDYDMLIEHSGGNGLEIAESVKIQVRAGQASSITSTRKTDPRSIADFQKIDTVEKMFKHIQDLRDKTAASVNSKNKADVGFPKLNIKYHDKLGYPTKMSILWSLASDAQTTFEVRKLEPVNVQ